MNNMMTSKHVCLSFPVLGKKIFILPSGVLRVIHHKANVDVGERCEVIVDQAKAGKLLLPQERERRRCGSFACTVGDLYIARLQESTVYGTVRRRVRRRWRRPRGVGREERVGTAVAADDELPVDPS